VKPVSAETERRLTAALARLLAGEQILTDGRLTVANLAREAEVARATANRAGAVVAVLRQAMADRRAAVPPMTLRSGDSEEQARRANEHILAQHIQLRALLGGDGKRRDLGADNVVPLRRR